MSNDLTKYGAQSWRDLQAANNYQFIPSEEPEVPPVKETNDQKRRRLLGEILSQSNNMRLEKDNVPVGLAAARANYGESKFDERVADEHDLENLNDFRYNQQGAWDVLANSLTKMLGIGATTFLSSFGTFTTGIPTAISEGRFSGLWDNKFSEAMTMIDEEMEKSFKNYVSDYQQRDPSWRLGDLNWWGDNFIKNVGFTLGAAAAGSLFSGGLGLIGEAFSLVGRAQKIYKNTTGLISSLFGAAGEGASEAKNLMNDMEESMTAQLDASLEPEYEAAEKAFEATGDIARYRETMMALDKKREDGLQDIHDRVLNAGNVDFWMNIPILTASNWIQFGKMFNKSYANAARVAEQSGKTGVKNVTRTTAKEAMEATAKKAATEGLGEGEKIVEYGAKEATRAGKTWAWLKNPISEGNEEMAQQFASSMSGRLYSEDDASEYWRAKTDEESENTALSFGARLLDAVTYGLDNSYMSGEQWEQGFIGALTGGMGMVMPTVKTKQGKDGKTHRTLGLEWSGGSFQDYKDYMAGIRGGKELADKLNQRVSDKDFINRFRSQVAHAYYQSRFDAKVEEGDKKGAKDELDKQFAVDVESFVRAGKTEDLRTIYKYFAESDLSDDEIDGYIKSASQVITQNQDKLKQQELAYPKIERAQTEHRRAQKAYDRIRESLSHKRGRRSNKELEKLEKARVRYENAEKRLKELTDGYMGIEGQASYSNPYLDKDGNPIDKDGNKISLEQLRDNVRQELKDNGLKALQNLDMYLEASNEVHDKTKGVLSDEQENLLTFYNYRKKRATDRAGSIIRDNLNNIPEWIEMSQERYKYLSENKQKGVTLEERVDDKGKTKYYAKIDAENLNNKELADAYDAVIIGNSIFGTQLNREASENAKRDKANARDYIDRKDRLMNDFDDFYNLMTDSVFYGNTYDMYLKRPDLMQTSAEKVEEEKEKKDKEKKFEESTVSDVVNDVLDGKITGDELREAAKSKKGKDEESVAEKAARIIKKYKQMQTDIDNDEHVDPNDPRVKKAKEIAKRFVEEYARNVDDADEIDTSMLEEYEFPIDEEVGSPEEQQDVDAFVRGALQRAFDRRKESEDKRSDIPDKVPAPAPEPEETGSDPVSKTTTTPPDVNTPPKQPVNTAPFEPSDELSKQIEEHMKQVSVNPTGAMRMCTTRYAYGRTDVPYYETLFNKDSVQYKRSKAIHDYLKGQKAYDFVENAGNDRIKVGDNVHLMVRDFSEEIFGKKFNELNDEQKPQALVILVLDSNNVLGDLPLAQFESSYGTDNPTPGVSTLTSLQEKLFKAFEEKQRDTGCKEAIVDNMKRNGAENLNLKNNDGSPLMAKINQVGDGLVTTLTGVYNSLNTVAGENSSPVLAVFKADRSVATGKNPISREIKDVGNANIGQPFMLFPTASGKMIALPIYTKTFDPDSMKDTDMYKLVHKAVVNLLNLSDKEAYKKNMPTIKAFLQVEWQKEAKRLITFENGQYTLHLQRLGKEDEKINITVPGNRNHYDIATDLLEGLTGERINVSNDFINGEIEGVDYNKIIGAISDINVPANTTHTVNSGFMVTVGNEENKPQDQKTRTYGMHTYNIGGREVTIDADDYKAIDSDGKRITGDEEVNVLIARVKAAKFNSKEPFRITIDGEIRTFDPRTNKFVNNQPVSNNNPNTSGSQLVKGQDMENFITRLQEDSKGFVLCNADGSDNPEGDFYKDKDGNLYARVTSMIEGDPKVKPWDDSPSAKRWSLVSTPLGNQVDELIRSVFDGTATKKILQFRNLEPTKRNELMLEIEALQKSLGNWKVVSRDVRASGVVTVKGPDGNPVNVRVSGTLDLLLYNPTSGKFAIFDIKSHRWALDPKTFGEGNEHYDKWQAQLSMYKQLLEAKYPEMRGNITGLKIVPVKMEDKDYDANDSSKEYAYDDKGFLIDKNQEGRQIVRVRAEYKGYTITMKERQLDIDMGKKGFKKAYTSKEGLEKITIANNNQPSRKVKLNKNEQSIDVVYTSKSGKQVTGKYTSATDAEGFIHIRHEGHVQAKMNVSPKLLNELGLTVQDIVGEESQWDTHDNYQLAVDQLNDELVSIDDMTIRPDGSVFIATDQGFAIEGEAARKIAERIFGSDFSTNNPFEKRTTKVVSAKERAISSLGAYFEGGGRFLTDDFPEVPVHLIDKLGSYFRGDGEFSDEDFTELQKYIGFNEDPNRKGRYIPERIQQAQQPEQQPEQQTNPSEPVGLSKESKEVWNKIPDDLKAKFNSGSVLVLRFGRMSVEISNRDMTTLDNLMKKVYPGIAAGRLEITEKPKAMERGNEKVSKTEREKEAREWLAKNLPMLSSEERTRFVDKLLAAGKDSHLLWGTFRNGIIQILNNAPYGAVYHEAFHYVMDFVLNEDEKARVLEAAREVYKDKDATDAALEEKLAEDFRKYVINENDNSIAGKIKRWFRKMMEAIKRWRKIDNDTINNLFWKINNGQFADKSVTVEDFKYNQQRVLEEIQRLRREKLRWENLDKNTRGSLRRSGISEREYESMCADEQEQWIKCRV